MRRPFLAMLALLLFVVLFSAYYLKMHFHMEIPEETLVKSFKCTGARVVSSEISFWGRLGEEFDSLEKMKSLVTSFADNMDLPYAGDIPASVTESDMVSRVDLCGQARDGSIVSISAHQSMEGEGEAERYITVNIVDGDNIPGLADTRRNICELFEENSIEPSVSSCITGSFRGKLECDQMDEICRRVFAAASARKVQGTREDNAISVAAYSPNIGDSVELSGMKVNVSLAIRYNPDEDITYIWLATPLITPGYRP